MEVTIEQQINILEHEIKLNEDKIHFYNKSPFYKNQMEQAVDMKKYSDRIQMKYKEIEKLSKQL